MKSIGSKKLAFFLLVFVPGFIAVSGQGNTGWPGFHGYDRLNKSKETGLLKAWPENGPTLEWNASGIGEGFSSMAIADGLVFTSGKSDDQTYVFAFDMDGKLVWKKANGAARDVEVSWASSYNGPRSTPTYDNGIVYHLGEAGKLSAYKSKTGELVWTRELTKDFQAEIPVYGFSESVLVDGNNLYVRPGGKTGFQVCLDKTTGETIWVNNEIPGTNGYNSLVISDFGGFRQLIGASSNCYYSVDAKTGKLIWKFDFENQFGLNCTDAIVFNEYVFITTEVKGSALLQMKQSGDKISIEQVWQNDQIIDNEHGGVLLHNGYVYGCGAKARSWFCIEFLTGKVMWKTEGLGSLTFADSMLYLYDDRGTVTLAKASELGFEKTGEFKVPSTGKGPHWAHPVVSGGKLYLRHNDGMFRYDI